MKDVRTQKGIKRKMRINIEEVQKNMDGRGAKLEDPSLLQIFINVT